MRRSICYCEPNSVKAGDVSTYKFVYTTATELAKGAGIKFDMSSTGRAMDWEIPQTNLQKESNLIWALLPNDKIIKAKKIENLKNLSTEFEFILPVKIDPGQTITILVGTPTKDTKKNGNRCQTFTQRKKSFNLYIDPKGKGEYKDVETFYLDIKGTVLSNLKIIVPSVVSRNRRFDVIVRFEDAYGNLTNYAPEGTLVDLSYENLRENLNWKLFVPETGFLTLPNIYLNEAGTYRIKLKNLMTNQSFISPPIKCFADTNMSLFWGLFHGESQKFDCSDNIENCLRYFRDEQNLQFYSTSCFDSIEETSNDLWKTINQHISEVNEDERFTAFNGSIWAGTPKEEGARLFLNNKDQKPLLRRKDLKSNSLKKIYKTTQSKDFISIPIFTMGKNSSYDFNDFNPDFEKVVEIYNAWGSSECSEKEGNLRPIKGKAASEDIDGSIRKALAANCRFGFVAGGFDDRGIFNTFYDSNQVQYSAGLTAIISKDQTRESIFEALSKRLCYATTGERIILGFNIAEEPMGSILSTSTKPGLNHNRYITGFVVGTGPLKSVEIIRNGKVFYKNEKLTNDFEFTMDDFDPLSDISYDLKDSSDKFSYYYLRVVQNDGHIAWSSPIWIDLQSKLVFKKPIKKK